MSDHSANTTTAFLLNGLRDPRNKLAWQCFFDRFRPVLRGVARRVGLNDDEADEAVQRTMIQFAREFQNGAYDPKRGRLRNWLLAIASYRIIDVQRERARGVRRGESAMISLAGESDLEHHWEAEYDRHLFQSAWIELRRSSRLEPNTFEAFKLYVLDELPATDVAVRCGIPVDEVYGIKYRLMRRLQELLHRLRSAHEDGL